MATLSISEYHDSSLEFRALVEDAKTDLAARLAGRETDDSLLTIYRELESESKENPNSRHILMTAIIAGEMVVAASSNGDVVPEVKLSLADLLVRRSEWDPIARLCDIEFASVLISTALLLLDSALPRISALQTLSAILEERYARTGDNQDLLQAHQRLQEAANLAEPSQCHGILASAACLLFKIKQDALNFILDIPVEDLSKTPVSWSKITHKKFRFIDARSLAAGKSLRVVEFDALPRQRYVALSYVWRGHYVPDVQDVNARTMSIEGAIGADPISIDVLITACKCVATLGCQLLWIDGVCIVQSDEEDKAWQIQNMFDIYKHCKQSLVLPGGLSRLVPITEPTNWMHRAWTLQEAVAPESCTVLFAWTRGDCVLQTHMPLIVTEVEPGKAAKADLYQMLTMSMNNEAHVVIPPNYDSTEKISINILVDSQEKNQAAALLGAISYRGKEGLESAIWRASFIRVASRPADAVFSIMGILGVNLDPLQFDPNDRIRPTIALMQALLRKGERAEWLGVAPHVDINSEISTLPMFPTIGPQGRALVQSRSLQSSFGSESTSAWMGDTWWRLVGAPRGSMDDDGTLTLHVLVLPIRRDRSVESLDIRPVGAADVWYTAPSAHGPPYAVKIGHKERYTNAAMAPLIDQHPWLVMLVEDDDTQTGRLRNLGYAAVSHDIVNIAESVERDVVIGPMAYKVAEEHMGGHELPSHLVETRRGGRPV